MVLNLLVLFCSLFIIDGKHFNGGTINWAPINPYTNSTSVPIAITQTYSWTYPYIRCANNVPTSTPGWGGANFNLTCVVDCITDGGYSAKPINILTDCTSASTSLSMLSSTKSKNLTLNAGAHFYLAYLGTAWVALNYPPKSGLEWSIVTFIDLRMRPDGFLNTPPVATVVSPQYAFVNRTIQIQIPVSDANVGDDVRCRWSTYTSGSRKKRLNTEQLPVHKPITSFIETAQKAREFLHIRKKRGCEEDCGNKCVKNCKCNCDVCEGTACGGEEEKCKDHGGCEKTTTIASTTTSQTVATTTTIATTTVETTTTETIGTVKSTSSFPVRQAIDECGGICYPGSLPSGTTLANCTVTFTGTRAGVWYAVAVQVEDFINTSSTKAMSSVPVQFLIYVLPQPACSKAPLILPISGCLEVQVGVAVSIPLYAMNLCSRAVANLTDIIVSDAIGGMSVSNLTSVPTNSSLFYVTLTWIPEANQVGFQEICAIAFTSEKLQSDQYCEIFTVKNSPDLCVTTSTTSTSTTTQSTTSTTQTTTTTTSTTTSVTTSTTSVTTTTSTTSTSTTSTSSTSSTSTSTTSTTTSTSTSSTSSTSTSTSTTSTTSSTTTTSVTTSTVTTSTTVAKTANKPTNWLLILGLSLLALLLAVCCACCCLYWFLWYPGAGRRRRRRSSDDREHQAAVHRYMTDLTRNKPLFTRLNQSNSFNNDSAVGNNTLHTEYSMINDCLSDSDLRLSDRSHALTDIEKSRIPPTVSVKKVTQSEIAKMSNIQQLNRNKVKGDDHLLSNDSINPSSTVSVIRVKRVPNLNVTDTNNSNIDEHDASRTTSTKFDRVTITKSSRTQRSRSTSIEQFSMEMQPMTNHAKKSATSINDRQANTNNGVKVSKVSRRIASTRSYND